MTIKKAYPMILFLCSLFSFSIQCEAQLIDVVASSGGYFQGSKLNISFTIGESVVETLQTESVNLTQGFQQPNLMITALDDFTTQEFKIKAYPNPTTDFVNINTNILLPPDSYYLLTDMHGSLLSEKTIADLTTKISFTQLVPSIYYLTIRHQNKILKTFKIIKR